MYKQTEQKIVHPCSIVVLGEEMGLSLPAGPIDNTAARNSSLSDRP